MLTKKISDSTVLTLMFFSPATGCHTVGLYCLSFFVGAGASLWSVVVISRVSSLNNKRDWCAALLCCVIFIFDAITLESDALHNARFRCHRETFGWCAREGAMVCVQPCGARRRYACHGHILFVRPSFVFAPSKYNEIPRCNEIVDISWQSDRGERGRIILFRLCATPSVYFCFVSLAGRKNYTQPEQEVKRFLLRRFASVRRFVFSYFSLPPPTVEGIPRLIYCSCGVSRSLAFACTLEFVFSIFLEFSFANSCWFISLICISQLLTVRHFEINYFLRTFN
jgi:hypothetical protein